MDFAVLNGRLMALEKLNKCWQNYGTFFGDGVYEVIRSYNGRIFALDDHIKRLSNSLEGIELDGVNVEQIKQQIIEVFDKAKIKNAKIYAQVTRGCGPRSHFLEENITPDVLIMISELPDFTDQKQNGIKAITYPDLRWKRCDIKSLNLLPNVMASRAAQKKGCQEAILVSEQGFITEGAGSGFFAINNGKLYTTPLKDNILPSISRKYILKAAADLNIELIEEHLSPQQAQKFDEMFIGVTTRDIIAIVQFDGQPIGNGQIGPITIKLQNQFQKYT